MWKYKCKTIFLSLCAAFLLGFGMAMFASQNDVFVQLMSETLPAEALKVFSANPVLIGVSAGLGFAGLLNVFMVGNLLSSFMSGSQFAFMLFVILMPEIAIMLGILLLPVMVIVTLYGWISLNRGVSLSLKKANIAGDDEIVRIYQIHHPLDPAYEKMGKEARATVRNINIAYGLGMVAMICVLFFVENLLLDAILFVIMIIAFQYLTRLRQNAFASIASLLINECNPEGCASALIYYGQQRNGHYKLLNRALLAQCFIYLNEPELAQDVLIAFQRSSTNNLFTYWSIMGYSYYLLKDESGLVRAKTEIENIRMGMGNAGLMIKSEELASLENKINLMHGDFNTCKKYYLNLLRRTPSPLQKADCDYYIALISFVQEDYDLAKMYFEKTVAIGNKLYFVRNAKNYLRKIEKTDDPSQTVYALSQGEDHEE